MNSFVQLSVIFLSISLISNFDTRFSTLGVNLPLLLTKYPCVYFDFNCSITFFESAASPESSS